MHHHEYSVFEFHFFTYLKKQFEKKILKIRIKV